MSSLRNLNFSHWKLNSLIALFAGDFKRPWSMYLFCSLSYIQCVSETKIKVLNMRALSRGGGGNFHYKGIYRCAAGMGYTFQASQYMNGYHFYIKSISIGYLFHPKSI